MKNIFIFVGTVVLLLLVASWWSKSSQSNEADVTKLCVQHGGGVGMHIHPQLSITVKGESMEIPANVGIPSPACMRPVHTHDNSGTLHLEFNKPRPVKLGEFFKVWGKQFSYNCVLDFCSGPDGTVKMFVNGQENKEFENYLMNDKDKIEIRYE